MAVTQAQRQFKLTTPLGKDKLLFQRMNATERLSGLFEIELNLLSTDASIKAQDIVGAAAGVAVELPAGGERHFHGHVAEFSYAGALGELHAYHATLRPWLWFLTRTADCRIFQKKTTIEIVRKIFEEQEKQYGSILNTAKVYGLRPTIQKGVQALQAGILASGLIAADLRHLLCMKAASINGCPY